MALNGRSSNYAQHSSRWLRVVTRKGMGTLMAALIRAQKRFGLRTLMANLLTNHGLRCSLGMPRRESQCIPFPRASQFSRRTVDSISDGRRTMGARWGF